MNGHTHHVHQCDHGFIHSQCSCASVNKIVTRVPCYREAHARAAEDGVIPEAPEANLSNVVTNRKVDVKVQLEDVWCPHCGGRLHLVGHG